MQQSGCRVRYTTPWTKSARTRRAVIAPRASPGNRPRSWIPPYTAHTKKVRLGVEDEGDGESYQCQQQASDPIHHYTRYRLRYGVHPCGWHRLSEHHLVRRAGQEPDHAPDEGPGVDVPHGDQASHDQEGQDDGGYRAQQLRTDEDAPVVHLVGAAAAQGQEELRPRARHPEAANRQSRAGEGGH